MLFLSFFAIIAPYVVAAAMHLRNLDFSQFDGDVTLDKLKTALGSAKEAELAFEFNMDGDLKLDATEFDLAKRYFQFSNMKDGRQYVLDYLNIDNVLKDYDSRKMNMIFLCDFRGFNPKSFVRALRIVLSADRAGYLSKSALQSLGFTPGQAAAVAKDQDRLPLSQFDSAERLQKMMREDGLISGSSLLLPGDWAKDQVIAKFAANGEALTVPEYEQFRASTLNAAKSIFLLSVASATAVTLAGKFRKYRNESRTTRDRDDIFVLLDAARNGDDSSYEKAVHIIKRAFGSDAVVFGKKAIDARNLISISDSVPEDVQVALLLASLKQLQRSLTKV